MIEISKNVSVDEAVYDEMVGTETEWVWAQTSNGHKEGAPVYAYLKKLMFASWIDAGWVKEKPCQPVQLNLF